MTLLLDTNTCIAIIKGTNPRVLKRFKQAADRLNPLAPSSIVEFELVFGLKNSHPDRYEENSRKLDIFFTYPFLRLPFTTSDAHEASSIRANLKPAGTSIGAYDLLIAGRAVHNQCTVVTANVNEFARVAGLKYVNLQRKS